MTIYEEVELQRMALAVRRAELFPREQTTEESEFLAASKAAHVASMVYSDARKRRDDALEALRPMVVALYQQLKVA
jgi:hypothetical protein